MARVFKARNISYHAPHYESFERTVGEGQPAVQSRGYVDGSRINQARAHEPNSQAIIQKAMEEAEKIKKDAYIQGEKLGYEAGLSKGIEEGLKEGRQSVDEEKHRVLRSCKHLYESILKKRQQLVNDVGEEMLELSYDIAEKILCLEIDRNDALIIEVFKQAVNALMAKQKVSVKLNPVDAKQLSEAKEPLIEELGLEGLNIIADPKLDRMSCLVKTPNETVDASVKTQLSEIKTQQKYLNEAGESYE